MICLDRNTEPVRSYKAFKNQVFKKYEDKARNIKNNINQNSLKEADKIKLKKKLIDILRF